MKQSGLTLIEMLLSITICLLLTSAMFDAYVGTHTSFNHQSTVSRLQSAAGVCLESLSAEIQTAGYIGCAALSDSFPIQSYLHYHLTAKNKLEIIPNGLIVRHAGLKSANLISLAKHLKGLVVSDELNIKPLDILIITDCQHAEIFQVKKVYRLQGALNIETVQPLHSEFDHDAEISFFITNRIFARQGLFVENIKHVIKKVQEDVIKLQVTSLATVIFHLTIRMGQIERDWYGEAKTA